MKTDDLLEELRRECPILLRILASWRDFGDKDALLVLEQLAALKRKWEAAAAERMRERCARVCRLAGNSVAAGRTELTDEELARKDVYDTCEEMIRTLEPTQ